MEQIQKQIDAEIDLAMTCLANNEHNEYRLHLDKVEVLSAELNNLKKQ